MILRKNEKNNQELKRKDQDVSYLNNTIDTLNKEIDNFKTNNRMLQNEREISYQSLESTKKISQINYPL